MSATLQTPHAPCVLHMHGMIAMLAMGGLFLCWRRLPVVSTVLYGHEWKLPGVLPRLFR